MNREPLDPRSTWRKRLRRVLENSERPYVCEHCGRTNSEEWREAAWGGVYSNVRLEANHINKCLEDIDLVNAQWLCTSCHKVADSVTAKGVSKLGDEYGYVMLKPTEED